VAFATRKIIAFGKASVQAFAADEKAAKSLSVALQNTGNGFAGIATEGFIARMQDTYNVLDDELRPAFQTLLNATGATNFVYQIIPKGKKVSGPIPRFGHQLKPDMQKLVSLGYTLKFIRIDNETHQQNMNLVDSKLAEYVARCLFETTQHRKGHFSQIAELVFPPDKEENKAALLKLKQYLGYVMLGMAPSTPWSGQPNDFGGLIIVKSSGDVLFYYLYNMADFQEFLYRNLKFEYGSRNRHRFGKPFEEGGKTFIKLNLQLRFI
jgi:type II restriction enzyme